MKIQTDDGFFYGLGLFETIGTENGRPVLLTEHLARLRKGAVQLGIDASLPEDQVLKQMVSEKIEESGLENCAVKITLTDRNLLITTRENPYRKNDYQKGFFVRISPILRNESSPLTYLKSLNYGDNILEKRRAHAEGFDEPVFLNTKGELTEGATTNLFVLKDGKLYTPPVSCGLLDGIMRQNLMKRFPVEERILYPEDIREMDAMFLTNSLLRVMPVREFITDHGTVPFSTGMSCLSF